jgi:hypothetical protein
MRDTLIAELNLSCYCPRHIANPRTIETTMVVTGGVVRTLERSQEDERQLRNHAHQDHSRMAKICFDIDYISSVADQRAPKHLCGLGSDETLSRETHGGGVGRDHILLFAVCHSDDLKCLTQRLQQQKTWVMQALEVAPPFSSSCLRPWLQKASAHSFPRKQH